MNLSRSIVAGLLVAAIGFASGCSGLRPLQAVQDSGDRAYEAGDFQQARADYAEFVDRRPGRSEIHHRLGVSYLELGEVDLAVHHLWIARDLKPTNNEFAASLAEGLFQVGDRGALYGFLREMVIEPGRVEDYIRLGQYAARLGDADEAHNALQTAARIDGGRTPEPQIALADFYKSIGDRERALERLRMALFLDPQNAEVAVRIRELGEIPGPSLALEPAERGDF